MSLLYVIDGYNVIHHPLFLRQAGRKEVLSYQSLLDFFKIKKPQGSLNNKVVIFFDGYSPSQIDNDFYGNTRVVFSCEISADERIKTLVRESHDRKNIVVVSDDKEIISAVRLLGARSMAVEDFIGPKERKETQGKEEPQEQGLNYSQIHRINQELRKLWLK